MTIEFLRKASGYRCVAKGDTATIYIYGIVDTAAQFFGDGVTAKMIADDLNKAGSPKKIDVRINSPGGDVFEGRAIYTQLRERAKAGAKITTYVDAEASSIASLIMMAGDERRMADGSLMMIHSAWTHIAGNAEELRKQAEVLDMVDATLVETYQSKSGQEEKKIKKWMIDETWFSAQEAADLGFATAVDAPMAIAALSLNRADFGVKHVPAALQPNRLKAAEILRRIQAVKNS